jgi:hypothetical protein
MMTLAMSVAAILGVVDVNHAHDYYHYSDRPNFANGYYENHPCCYCSVCSGEWRQDHQ